MVKGRAEVTVKFSEVPQSYMMGDRVKVSLDCDGWITSATIKAKSWRKAVASMVEYPAWVGAISGKLGQKTEKGFDLIDAGVQVFEKKPKETSSGAEEVKTVVEANSIMGKPVLSLSGRRE